MKKKYLFWLGGAFVLVIAGAFFLKTSKSAVISDSITAADSQDENFSEEEAAFQSDEEMTVQQLAIVDLKKIASQSKAGKNIESRIAEINNKSKIELSELESKIKTLEENRVSDINAGRTADDMLVALYDKVRSERYRISEAYRNAISNLEKEIRKIIATVAQEKKLKIVVISDAVVYSSKDCLDLSDEIVSRMNQECPEIKVTLEGRKDNGQ